MLRLSRFYFYQMNAIARPPPSISLRNINNKVVKKAQPRQRHLLLRSTAERLFSFFQLLVALGGGPTAWMQEVRATQDAVAEGRMVPFYI
jgi:hypothetical protein